MIKVTYSDLQIGQRIVYLSNNGNNDGDHVPAEILAITPSRGKDGSFYNTYSLLTDSGKTFTTGAGGSIIPEEDYPKYLLKRH